MEVPYDDLDPGIRQVVRWLNDHGFETTDSGDGVSKFREDEVDTCAMDHPNVAIRVEDPADLVPECDRLATLLAERGCGPVPMGPEVEAGVVNLQGFYDPSVGPEGYILLMGLDDKRWAG